MLDHVWVLIKITHQLPITLRQIVLALVFDSFVTQLLPFLLCLSAATYLITHFSAISLLEQIHPVLVQPQ